MCDCRKTCHARNQTYNSRNKTHIKFLFKPQYFSTDHMQTFSDRIQPYSNIKSKIKKKIVEKSTNSQKLLVSTFHGGDTIRLQNSFYFTLIYSILLCFFHKLLPVWKAKSFVHFLYCFFKLKKNNVKSNKTENNSNSTQSLRTFVINTSRVRMLQRRNLLKSQKRAFENLIRICRGLCLK